MRIPPHGSWGTIEAAIWELKYLAEAAGHEFYIVNTKDRAAIVAGVNRIAPDVVHLHCEFHFHLASYLRAKVRIIGSQWPRLYEPENEAEAMRFFAGDAYVCCVSERIRRRCLEMGIAESRLLFAPTGACSDLIDFRSEADFPDRAICLAPVNPAQRQHYLKHIPWVEFAGPIRPKKDPAFERHPTYLGDWTRAKVRSDLSNYAGLVLLTKEGTAPLAIYEALMAGLGVVISEAAVVNLDSLKPFVTVMPEHRISDRDFVTAIIKANLEVSRSMRREIRRYAIENFDSRVLAGRYFDLLDSLLIRVESETK
jgi:hypothetical protein